MKRNTYTLFWLTGESELVEGYDISDAMNCAGYGAVALRALDFYARGDIRNKYEWVNNKWSKID